MRSRHAWLLSATVIACDPFSSSDPTAPVEAGVEDAARPDAATANCDGWTSGILLAIAGDANATDKNWTESRYGHQCGNGDVHLYCLED